MAREKRPERKGLELFVILLFIWVKWRGGKFWETDARLFDLAFKYTVHSLSNSTASNTGPLPPLCCSNNRTRGQEHKRRRIILGINWGKTAVFWTDYWMRTPDPPYRPVRLINCSSFSLSLSLSPSPIRPLDTHASLSAHYCWWKHDFNIFLFSFSPGLRYWVQYNTIQYNEQKRS